MSNLNLRLYADQFYGLYIPKLNNYLSKIIEKDSFISSFKSGFLNYKDISTKTQIKIYPTLIINSIKLNSLNVKIPDENGDLIINIEGLKGNILLSEMNENDLKEMIIKDKKELKEKFVEIIFNKITKKTKNNLFGGIIFESIGNKILSGLVINIKNFESIVKFQNYEFITSIGNIEFNLKNKNLEASIKELKIIFKEEKNDIKENIVCGSNINISTDFIDNEEGNDDNKELNCFTKLKIGINNIQINLRTKIINAFFEVINCYKGFEQKKIDLRKKKLIQFHKPKIKDKNYFKLLWQYAIRSVMKLRKYDCFNKTNIFEISNFTQSKLILKGNNEDIILINDINLLKSTKSIIEKKIIDSKDSIANKFFSFFSSKSEEPKTLTDEEKASIEEYFKEENLIKYLKGELFEAENEDNPNYILKKYSKYLNDFESELEINIFDINFKNNLKLNDESFYLHKIKFDFVFKENNFNFNFNLFEKNNINSDIKNKISEDKTELNNEKKEEKNIISFSYDNSDKLKILIEKENIEITEDNLFLFICYTKFILEKIIETSKNFNFAKNAETKNINIERIFKKIYLPFLPSLVVKTHNENKIDINISDYSWNEKLVLFKVDIKESTSSILNLYKFEINLNDGFTINFDQPVNININKTLIEEFIYNFTNIYNDIYLERKIEQKLFNFDFTKYLDNVELFNNNANIIIKEFNLNINDSENKSSIKLKEFNLKFENKNISLISNQVLLEIDLLSLSPIINHIKDIKNNLTNESKIHYKLAIDKIVKSIKLNINNIDAYLYLSHKNSYLNSSINNIFSESDPQNIYIMNNTINNIFIKYVDVNIENDTIILKSNKMESNIRIISLNHYVFNTNIYSPLVSLAVILYNYEEIQKLSQYFLKLKNIYEINIKNLKCEYFKEIEDSNLSIYITNFKNKKEKKDIDLLHLEKYNLNYNIDSYTDLIIKVKSKLLEGEIAQRDISYIFFTIFSPDKKISSEENIFNRINSLNLDIDLNQVRCDFNLRIDYQKPLFDIFFGNISIKLDIYKKNLNNLDFSFNQFQLNYYESNINNNILIENKKPLAILDYEIEKSKNEIKDIPQIEIKKDIGNKFLINITKINFIFDIEKVAYIIYYFKDISIIDLLLDYKEKISKKEKNSLENLEIQIIISDIQLLFPRQNDYLSLYLNKIDFNYIKAFKGGINEYQIKFSLNFMDSIYLNRKIIFTKNEFLLFVLDIKEGKNIDFIYNSLINKLFIKISYLDLIFIYRLFLKINKLLQSFKKEPSELPKENINELEVLNDDNNSSSYKFLNFSEIKSILSEINIEGIDITLLEEDENYIDMKTNYKYFYPFFNISLNKSYLKYELSKNNKEKFPDINFDSNFNLMTNYYNYNYKIWEPLTEDLTIKFNYMNKNESNKLFDNYTLEINKLALNISDTFINILLIKIFGYYNKFQTKIKNNIPPKLSALNEIILKYKISNYTDIDFDINYQNKKKNIKKSEELYIDFSSEEENINSNLNNIIILNVENSQSKILIFPENIGIKKYKLYLNNVERNIYIESKIKQNKHIEILIYNSIIIKNKTSYSFNIKINESKKESILLNLESNSCVSFPDFMKIDDTILNVYLEKDDNENDIKLKLSEIVPKEQTKKLSKEILFERKNIFFSLVSKIKSENLIGFSIIYKYSIINCLPCSIYISKIINQTNKSNDNENIEIKKNSLYNIENASFFTQSNSIFLKIKIQGQYYTSKLSLMRNDTKTKLINFVNSSNDKQIILQIIIKESYKNKAMIIYSENILYNNSGIGLNIFTQDENNHNYMYDIGNNLYLFSSEIKKTNSFICIKSSKNIFITKYIKYEDFKKMELSGFSLNFEGKKDIFSLDLIIDKSTTNLWFENDEKKLLNKINEKNENKVTIYTILPKYNIINFTEKKVSNYINLMLKNSQKYLLGINIKNLEEIKNKSNYFILENLSENSLYTICLKGNIYNIEIKKSQNGVYKNIFIFNNNLKNSQALVENKTNYEIIVKQKTFEKFKQKIKNGEKQILKIYDQTNKNFSAEIDNKLYFFNLNETGQKLLKKNLFLYIENDRISTKIIFYIKSLNQNSFQKSKSLMNLIQPNFNNLKLNFNKDKYIKINLLLNHISISIISQNKKERKEIVLIFIKDFQSGIKLLTSKSHSKYKIKLNTKISSFEAYNLLSTNNSYLCLNTTSPLINIYSELIYDLSKNKISIFELVTELGDIKLNITPVFLQGMYNFVQNIYENFDIYMKQISPYFLSSNLNNLNSFYLQNDYNYYRIPLTIIISKMILSGVKIRFKLKKEGIESLPKIIIDSINYFKCFPFFDIGKETKAILSRIELQGPYKDITSLLDELKVNIITQLSTEIVIKVLHPSNNEIKDNMKNMIGFDSSKLVHKINLENSSRIKFKRTFIRKNKFFKKYDKNHSLVEHTIKNLGNFNDKFYIDSVYNFNEAKDVLIFFEDCFIYANENGQNIKNISYKKLKEIKKEKINKKFIVSFLYTNAEEDKELQKVFIEFKNENNAEKIYRLLNNFSNV